MKRNVSDLLLVLLVFLLQANTSFSSIQDSMLIKQDTMVKVHRDLWKPIELRTPFDKHQELIPTRKRNFARAATEWFLVQAFPATFNRFITVDQYSFISFKNFINHQKISAWDWDDNEFSTNQLDHPYHGQLYFNSFRSNGYNFYESSIATFAGSYIWETAGETQAPSINDLVNTTIGGIILGEMTHRVSRNILARNRSGHNILGNEIVAFLVNPVNGLNRILDGKWGKKIDDYYAADSSHIYAEFDLGFRRFDDREGDFLYKGKNSIYSRLRFHYSNGDHDYKRPFDEFHVNLEVGNGDSTFVNAINVHALLSGAQFFKSRRGEHFGTLDAHYDFYNNDAFFYGAQSLVYNWNSHFTYKEKNRLNLSLGAGAVLLAAVPDPYLLYGASRNYNYGSGASYRFKGELSLLNRFMITGDYNGGYFHTISGNESYYFIHAAILEASLRLFKGFSLNLGSGYFALDAHFKDEKYQDFKRDYPFGRLSAGYNIQF